MGTAREALLALQPSDAPSELFHYTSTLGLLGILEKNSLWFTDTRYLNDSSEIHWGVGIIKDVALDFAATLKDDTDKILVDQVIGRLEKISLPNRAAVFCMCEKSNLLNQWRDYGRDVVSYCVGFDPKRMHMANGYNFQPILIKVIYDAEVQQAITEQVILGIYALAQAMPPETRDDPARMDFLIEAAAYELSLLTYWFKNPAFEAELEWRLLLEAGTIKILGNSPAFRASRVGVTPYFTWSAFNPKQTLPITSIMVGPCPWPDAAMAAVEQLLQERKYDGVQLRASTIPIR